MAQRSRKITLPFRSVDEKPYIFASYGHDDKEIVFPKPKELYEKGYNVRSLEYGDERERTLALTSAGRGGGGRAALRAARYPRLAGRAVRMIFPPRRLSAIPPVRHNRTNATKGIIQTDCPEKRRR